MTVVYIPPDGNALGLLPFGAPRGRMREGRMRRRLSENSEKGVSEDGGSTKRAECWGKTEVIWWREGPVGGGIGNLMAARTSVEDDQAVEFWEFVSGLSLRVGGWEGWRVGGLEGGRDRPGPALPLGDTGPGPYQYASLVFCTQHKAGPCDLVQWPRASPSTAAPGDAQRRYGLDPNEKQRLPTGAGDVNLLGRAHCNAKGSGIAYGAAEGRMGRRRYLAGGTAGQPSLPYSTRTVPAVRIASTTERIYRHRWPSVWEAGQGRAGQGRARHRSEGARGHGGDGAFVSWASCWRWCCAAALLSCSGPAGCSTYVAAVGGVQLGMCGMRGLRASERATARGTVLR
ncbi:hypothetical protein BDZ91DRAFT_762957 [Kalaharituber pfeilii]|nr:hypothetical protein BDZ91DRAFT_762957 [Kalaharituber pfeilii]